MSLKHSFLAVGLAVAAIGAASSAAAADVRIYGLVTTGLQYTNYQNGTTESGVAGKGQVPSDSTIHLSTRDARQ